MSAFSVQNRHVFSATWVWRVAVPAKHVVKAAEDKPIVPARMEWLQQDDASVSEARRAADKLFVNTQQEQHITFRHLPEANDGRRVLPSLDEPDFIAKMLQEEEASRPRRGRKPGSGLARVPRLPLRVKPPEAAPPAPNMFALDRPTKIAGYVRGRIFARYAKRSELGLGQFWRKTLKPAW